MTMVRRTLVPLTAAVVVGSSFVALPARGQAIATSPANRILVVTTNVQEAWGTADMRSQSELNRYVDRLVDQVPFVPDVVMLQEVRRKSAAYIRDRLTRATGHKFGWGVRPPRRPWTQNPRKRTETDSAILIDTDAVEKVDDGGFISLTYERKHATDNIERVEITRHARVSVRELDGDLTLAAASVHMQYGHLKERHVDRYQVTWTDKLARVMANRYPNAARTIGGDFNQDRCAERSGARTCRKSLFWRNLTDAPWNYKDVLFEVFLSGKNGVGLGGVDFIFTTGDPTNAGSDTSYDKSDAAEFYSDHRFFWGVVGP
ncbi:MAG: endonuclease/exonuclease/phosphatase family protein [Actinomycetota bacterium]|nr:endonuclease/exonuclease/phosphatase family protein [Actinomycetota bacterium]